MINWWLITLLSVFGVSWAYSLWVAKTKIELLSAVSAVAVVAGLMYMSGVFTELWGVYK